MLNTLAWLDGILEIVIVFTVKHTPLNDIRATSFAGTGMVVYVVSMLSLFALMLYFIVNKKENVV